MPRKRRIIVPGALHHIMARGIDGRTIFSDEEDKKHFVRLLAAGLERLKFRCYAWVLMENHYHLLLRVSHHALSELMRPLNMAYARYYNRKVSRRGYLFQDRYKSIASQDQGYIEEVIRYIHLNPLRAGTCRTLDALGTYKWSGHPALIGRAAWRFQDTEAVLRKFGSGVAAARKAYLRYIEEGVGASNDVIQSLRKSNAGSECVADHGCWVVGDPEFVRKALSADKRRRLLAIRMKHSGWNVEKLAQFVCGRTKTKRGEIQLRGRLNARSEARAVFVYLGHRVLGLSVSELAEFLGISGQAASAAMKRGGEKGKTIEGYIIV